MKRNMLSLLLVVACVWPAAVRAEVSVSEAQILINAGYAYNKTAGAWNNVSGEAISQNEIVKLFPQNVIDLTVAIAESKKTPNAAERAAFLAAVERKINDGSLAFNVSKPENGKVTVAELTKEEMHDAVATMPAANSALVNANAMIQSATWDGSAGGIILIKGGGGSSSHSSGGSFGGSSRSSGSSMSRGGGSSSSRGSGGSNSSRGTTTAPRGGGSSSSRGTTTAPRSGGSSSRGTTTAPRNGGSTTRTPSSKPSTSKPSAPAKNPVVDKKPLPSGGSQQTRRDGSVRTTRPTQGGGSVSEIKHPNGNSTRTVSDRNGNRTQTTTRVNPRTGKTSTTTVRTGKDGSRETIHSNGARSERLANGGRIHTSPNGNKVTVSGYSKGSNGTFTRTRTTVINNRTVHVTNNYRTVYRGGHSYYSHYYGYSPFFHPYLYSPLWSPFFYNPWLSPYYYGWGWYPHSYYSWYYTPYPYYTSPFFWLTDFVIRDAIYSSYQRNEGSSQSSEQSQPSQEQQKQAISEEVKAQVAVQVEEAMKELEAKKQPELQSAMNTKTVFMVNDEMTVTQKDENGEDGESCALESGDLVKLAAVPAENDVVATMKVVSSKSGGCGAKSTVSMSMENVQEMFNEFHERLEKGVTKMKEEKDAGTLKIGK